MFLILIKTKTLINNDSIFFFFSVNGRSQSDGSFASAASSWHCEPKLGHVSPCQYHFQQDVCNFVLLPRTSQIGEQGTPEVLQGFNYPICIWVKPQTIPLFKRIQMIHRTKSKCNAVVVVVLSVYL